MLHQKVISTSFWCLKKGWIFHFFAKRSLSSCYFKITKSKCHPTRSQATGLAIFFYFWQVIALSKTYIRSLIRNLDFVRVPLCERTSCHHKATTIFPSGGEGPWIFIVVQNYFQNLPRRKYFFFWKTKQDILCGTETFVI